MPPGNPNQAIFDQTVRHRIALERYSREDAKQALKWLEDLKQDIAARMVRSTPGRRAQLEALLDDTRSIHTATYRRIQDDLTGRWRARAGLEADFTAEKLRGAGLEVAIQRLTTDAAYQAALSRPMDGAVLRDWLSGMEQGARRRLDRSLTISWTEGESLDRSVRRMRETVDISKRSAQTVVRTANTHISNAVQQASAEANADIVKEVEWRSVLDSRTSPICINYDGQRFPIDSGPRPPAHPGCRSIILERLDGFPPAQRETYSEWITRQTADVQDEVLGPTRGRMLRAGTFKVTEFTDQRGRVASLAELNARRKPKRKPKSPPPPPPPPPKPRTVGRGSDIVTLEPIHGMSRAQKMRRTLVNGIEVFEPASDTYKRSRFTQSALNDLATGKIPTGLVYTSQKIVISRDRNKDDAYWAKKYKMPKFRSNATGGDKNIVLYGHRNLTGDLTGTTVSHEMGHNLQLRLHGAGNNPGPKYRALYDEAIANPLAEQPVRSYGRVAPAEDFSTAVEIYAYDPQTLRSKYPKRFALIDEMVKESEAMGPLGRRGTDWSND